MEKVKPCLCAYPIESYLALKPAAFEAQENSYRIYQALRQWAGVQALFTSDHPMVELGSLVGNQHGYAVLANHSPENLEVKVTSLHPLKQVRRVTPNGFHELKSDRHSWTMVIEGFSGAVVEWFI